MILHLKENIFSKLFITESKNSKRADKQTMQLIAQISGFVILIMSVIMETIIVWNLKETVKCIL